MSWLGRIGEASRFARETADEAARILAPTPPPQTPPASIQFAATPEKNRRAA